MSIKDSWVEPFVSLRYYWGVLETLGRRKELGEEVGGHGGLPLLGILVLGPFLSPCFQDIFRS